MKQLFFLIALSLTSIIFGQSFTESLQVSIYKPETAQPGLKAFELPVNFDRSNPLKAIPDSLDDLVIQHIDLVYSVNKENPEYDQKTLNQRRIQTLKSRWDIARNSQITWREIGQNGAKNRQEARQLFHGFVIYYRPTPTKEMTAMELDYIEKELSKSTIGTVEKGEVHVSRVEAVSARRGWSHNEIVSSSDFEGEETVRPARKHDFFSYANYECSDLHLFKVITNKEGHSRITDSLSRLPNWMGSNYYWTGTLNYEPITIYCAWAEKTRDCEAKTYEYDIVKTSIPSGLGLIFQPLNLDYNVVAKVYQRHPSWKNTHAIMDVTGSMAPYIAKTMAWVRETQTSSQIKAFTFFNDGDATPHHLKKTGKVGGIYSTENTSFKVVYDKMRYTMSKGGGGDCPENNVEAVIKGSKIHPDCDEIIMIADNWATPRDLSLVDGIGKPVHVILCGAAAGVNVQYIQLAYDTGGSVHTIEEDLETRDIKVGKTLKLGNTYYTLSEGKIVVAKNYY